MASIPLTYRAFRRSPGIGTTESPLKLSLSTEKTLPGGRLGSYDVLIKIHAVSLNYRDVLMLRGSYLGPVLEGGIVASDCAAEVVAVGEKVAQFKVGDRVAANFDLGNLTGEIEPTGHLGLGGDVEGVLREYAVYEERFLVRLPGHLSWEEVSHFARGMRRRTLWTRLLISRCRTGRDHCLCWGDSLECSGCSRLARQGQVCLDPR
jgi:NADPH:quinone reductase-like Zn-dependent oxidoreductase